MVPLRAAVAAIAPSFLAGSGMDNGAVTIAVGSARDGLRHDCHVLILWLYVNVTQLARSAGHDRDRRTERP